MNNPLRTADDYEIFLYTLPERFPAIQRSTLVFERRGATLARVDEFHTPEPTCFDPGGGTDVGVIELRG